MDFKINNRYWISCFVKDFINKEKVYMKKHNIEMFDIETFLHKIIEKNVTVSIEPILKRVKANNAKIIYTYKKEKKVKF